MLSMLEWSGAILGAVGALLLAFNNRWSGYGFVLFLASNFVLILYFFQKETYALAYMQIVFSFTSLLGIYRWLVLPRKRSSVGYLSDDDKSMFPIDRILCGGLQNRASLKERIYGQQA